MDFEKFVFFNMAGLEKGMTTNPKNQILSGPKSGRGEKGGEGGDISLSRLDHLARVKAVLPDNTFFYLTKPDAGWCRRSLGAHLILKESQHRLISHKFNIK